MPKPLRRIGASKLATVSEYHPSQAQASQVLTQIRGEASCQPLSTPGVARPSTGIVLTIACGPRAGEMLSTDDHEVLIGFNHDCLLRFASDQYPLTSGKLLVRRGTEGWYVLRVSGNSAFINQHLLKNKFPLRSGDIIRLSSRGPDVQFTMQSGGLAIPALVDRYLPQQVSTFPKSIEQATDSGQTADTGQLSASLAADRPAAVDAAAVDAEAVDAAAFDQAAAPPGSWWIDLPWISRL